MSCVVLMLLAFSLLTETECKQCSAGELNNGNGACSPCPSGTFMYETNHMHSSCFECEEKKANVPVHHDCNATHNTGCPIGSFQSEPYPQVCHQCTPCKFYAEPCTPESDAICCDHENMILVKKVNDSVKCVNSSNHTQYCCESQPQATSTRDPPGTTMAAMTTDKMREETSSADLPQSTEYPSNKTGPANHQSGLEDGARIAVSFVIGVLLPVFLILLYLFFKA